jgi:5-methylcytosine-specific restriction endonuclease McrA
VIPIARGGKHSIGNLVVACKPCNSQKNKRTIQEWRQLKLRLLYTQ